MHRSAAALLSAAAIVAALPAEAGPKKEYPPFDKVSEGYEKVVSTTDDKPSLYTLWVNEEEGQVLAELPRGWEKQKHFVALTQASGGIFAGLQGPERYVYWKKYGDRLALMEPELNTRSQGEQESKSSVERLFTDRVLVDIPIVTMGPSGQPVIDVDDLLVKQAGELVGGGRGRGGGGGGALNSRLLTIARAKAFPQNVEIAFEVPDPEGRLMTLHYSISLIPDDTGYKPREADERVGYFTTVFRDLGQYDEDKKWVRYIDRWHLEKRDPKLSVSPPREPIVFYLEHTIPVRYRRWVREGVEYWNEGFRAVGLDEAIEVRIQDEATGAHMDKDPEDVRYNFVRWLNNDISTAIGPHRAHPLTGQILDADIVLTDGWIRAYWNWYHRQMPEVAVQSMTPETLRWLESYPQWDPRLLLATPLERDTMLAERAHRAAQGETAPVMDPILSQNEQLAEISAWLGDEHSHCLAAHGKAFDMATARLHFHAMDLSAYADEAEPGMEDVLDGIPEWFIGPLLAELTCHEVGHTLGLRHNFKASSIYSLDQINSKEWKGKRPLAGSVMDYLPANFSMDPEQQGDFTMIGIGPYDKWAIEFGYTFDDPKKVLERVSEPELAYLTDDDTSGPDPLARRYDFSADPMEYAQLQATIVDHHRDRILERFVQEGQSWSKARDAYSMTLGMQLRAVSMMSNWVGGAHVNRDRKGDPGERAPVAVVDPQKQRDALHFLVEHALNDEAYGLTPELLQHMTVDKWSDQSPGDRSDPTWPVHDRISGIQNSVLTMVLNPTTLSRVLDNEYRTPADQDALTLPEVMATLMDAVYGELSTDLDGATFTDRQPMISSLRRNLQASMTDRLIALAEADTGLPRSIRTLSLHHLRGLQERVAAVLSKRDHGQLDHYTVAHLEDLNDRVQKALESVYVREL